MSFKTKNRLKKYNGYNYCPLPDQNLKTYVAFSTFSAL